MDREKFKYTIAVKTTFVAVLVALILLGTLIYMLMSLSLYRGGFRDEVDSLDDLLVIENARLTWTNMRSEDSMILARLQAGDVQSLGEESQRVQTVEASQAQIRENLDKLKGFGLDKQQMEILNAMEQSVNQYAQEWQAFTAGAATSDKAQLLAVSETFAQQQDEHGFNFVENSVALTQTYEAERTRSAESRENTRSTTLILSVVILVISTVVLTFVIRGLVKPLTRSAQALSVGMDKLSIGDFTAVVNRESSDEVGDMSENFNDAMVRLRTSVGATVTAANEVMQTAQGIGDGSRGVVEHITNAVDYINSGAAAAEQVSANISAVAAGAEEMSASIREISSNANSAAGVAKEASEMAQQTNETVVKLGESSKEIGKVIETITAVAEQTNLLALNATIEAARAGEAGRGFAVVASEVKDLAAETGRATEEVAVKVEQIQTDTEAAVAAIEEISNIIASINDYQTTIAAAVEEQTATTNEMSRSVSEAADSSTTIAENVSHIAKQTNALSVQFKEVTRLMEDLSDQSQDLVSRLDEMKY